MIIYTLPNCPACDRAKDALNEAGAAYDVHTFANIGDMRAFMANECQMQTVPKLYADGIWFENSGEIIKNAHFLASLYPAKKS